jgi:hypothetical protein
MISVRNGEMFIFQYEGLHQKIWPGESYSNKGLMEAGLDAIVDLSKDYIGEEVIVVFDNNKNITYSIGGDLINSTFRKGVLKGVTRPKKVAQSIMSFEDTPLTIQTIKLVDMVALQDLCYPVSCDNFAFLFSFFFHSRGLKNVLYSNPIGAFTEGRLKFVRPGCNCEQAFFSNLQSTSSTAYDDGLPERSSKEYYRLSIQKNFVSDPVHVIRCGKRNQ